MKELLASRQFTSGTRPRAGIQRLSEYIFGERNGIYIIDLQKTL